MNFLIRLLAALGPAVGMHALLKAGEASYPLFAYLAAACCIPLLKGPLRAVLTVLSLGVLALVSFVLILITPFSAYAIWFGLAQRLAMYGSVSQIFVLISGFLSLAAVLSLSSKGRFLPLIDVLSLNLFLLFISFRLPVFIAAAGAGLISGLALRNLKDRPLHPLRGVFVLLLVLSLSVFPALLLSSGRSLPKGVSLIDNHISGALKNLVLTLFPRFPVLYGIPGYGYGFREETRGRPILSPRPVFALKGGEGEVYRLRAQVFDFYTGSSWTRTPPSAGAAPEEGPLISFPSIFQEEPRCSLAVLTEFYPYLPHELSTEGILIPGRQGESVLGDLSSGFLLTEPLASGETIELYGTGAAKEAAALSPGERLRYTALPASVPGGLVGFAEPLRAVDDRRVPAALAEMLSASFTYSLDLDSRDRSPERDRPPGGGWDTLSGFLLRSKKGYCVHFATAAAVLFRLRGIPSRYVSGFLVRVPLEGEPSPGSRGDGRAVVHITGFHSHAWVEVWFPETGWVPFEATPPMMGGPDASDPSITDDDYTLRQIEAITGMARPERIVAQESVQRSFPLLLILIPCAVLLCLSALVLGKRLSHKELSTQRRRFFRLSRRLVRAVRSRGIPGPEISGWIAWEKALEPLIRGGASLSGKGSDMSVFREVFFGGREPGTQEAASVRRLLSELRRGPGGQSVNRRE
jgi:transglutaminase-like putative cysteine protease